METETYSMEALNALIERKKITHILKRDGTHQSIDLVQVQKRLESLCFGLEYINTNLIMWKVV